MGAFLLNVSENWQQSVLVLSLMFLFDPSYIKQEIIFVKV